MRIFGSEELFKDVVNHDLCIGCGACVNLCPYYKSYKGKTARIFPCDISKGRCYAYCPKAEVDLDELTKEIWNRPYDGSPLGNYRQILASRAGKKMQKGLFQAGGTVSALVTFALKNSMIDGAALTGRQGLTPVPYLVTDWQDAAKYALSKFMAAPTLAAVNEALAKGYNRLGVVATPCQATAVAQMRTNPMADEDFIDPVAFTIGLFCNWSLDTRQFAELLSQKVDIAGIKGMHIPPPPAGVMILETSDGRVEIPLSEIKPLIPNTCFICPDMTSEFSDVSVGMLEGRRDWNTLIIRSQKGVDLVENASRRGYLETEELPQKTVKHLSRAAGEKKARALRMLIRTDLLNNGEGTRSAVRIPSQIVKKILNQS
jgi:coenzyme F420 hydrogenase subunit beta